MSRLSTLSVAETRTLLTKYFEKVIDLREDDRKRAVECSTLEVINKWIYFHIIQIINVFFFGKKGYAFSLSSFFKNRLMLVFKGFSREENTEYTKKVKHVMNNALTAHAQLSYV